MPIPNRVQEALNKHGAHYDVLPHPYTESSMKTAEAAHVPGDRLAKSVILEDDDGFLMAVVPSTHKIELGVLHEWLHRELGLATEAEISHIFTDCDLGAIPPVGAAYGMETVVDETLLQQPEIYFEAGDHRDVIKVSREDFEKLLGSSRHGYFSHHM